MYRTLCVLALLTLQARLAHSFSWDIVASGSNRLEFYNEEKLTYSVTFKDVKVLWITYDPLHNRVLLVNSSESVVSFDIATRKIQTLIHLPDIVRFVYDPATGLLFVITLTRPESYKMYSYLVKPGANHEVDVNFVTDLKGLYFAFAVDSCGGYIYWIRGRNYKIERARINGSATEEVIGGSENWRSALTVDSQTQNMYWKEYDKKLTQYFILSADLNGKNRRTIYHGQGYVYTNRLTVSKDFFYWANGDYRIFWKFPKNLPLGTNVEPKQIAFKGAPTKYIDIAAYYVIEEQPQGTPLCKALKRLLPNYSATNDSDSHNVSTGGSLLPVNETKVSEESRVSGDIDVSVCHNYCLQGNCSVSAKGQPKCRCNVSYSGVRCEVNTCQAYCLNDGVCSLSEDNNPVCQCTGGYQGERCDVPALLIKCSQTVSMLKDILNADLTSVTEGKGVKSTCASTVF